MEVSGQLHAPAALRSSKEAAYLLDRRLGGPQRRSGRCGVKKNLLPLPGVERRLFSPLPVIIPTELSRLLYLIFSCLLPTRSTIEVISGSRHACTQAPTHTHTHTTNDRIILLLNMLKINGRNAGMELTQTSYAVHGDVNSSSYIGTLASYYLHRYIKFPPGLSCQFLIKETNAILLNWYIWTSSMCMF
jgi:hypothetical protein